MRILVLLGLLVLPVIAGQRLGAHSQWVGAYRLVLSALADWAYAVDKGFGLVRRQIPHLVELAPRGLSQARHRPSAALPAGRGTL